MGIKGTQGRMESKVSENWGLTSQMAPIFYMGENDDQPLDLSWATVPAASLFLPTHSWKRAMFQKGQLLRG
jgi:hypothetical protein